MKKKQIKSLLKENVEAISTNTFDSKLRIKVGGRWFVEDSDPALKFGTPYVTKL